MSPRDRGVVVTRMPARSAGEESRPSSRNSLFLKHQRPEQPIICVIPFRARLLPVEGCTPNNERIKVLAKPANDVGVVDLRTRLRLQFAPTGYAPFFPGFVSASLNSRAAVLTLHVRLRLLLLREGAHQTAEGALISQPPGPTRALRSLGLRIACPLIHALRFTARGTSRACRLSPASPDSPPMPVPRLVRAKRRRPTKNVSRWPALIAS